MKYIICWKIDVNTTHLELLTEDKYYSELKSKRFNITGTTGVKTESSASDKMAYIHCVGSVYIMLNMSNECTCTHNCKGLPNQGNYSSADIWGGLGGGEDAPPPENIPDSRMIFLCGYSFQQIIHPMLDFHEYLLFTLKGKHIQ